jgi:murein tripeptide amidase MpaA
MKSLTLLSAFFASALAAVIQPQKVSYDGYKVFRLSVENNNIDRINDIVDRLNLQTWKPAKKAGSFADLVVHPSQLEAFNKEAFGLKPIVLHEDLGASIAEESNFQPYAIGAVNSTWFNSYHAYADHLQFLKDLVAQFPTTSEIVTSGSSLNGNAITGIHFWGSGGKGIKPAVILHGTVHAREWITTLVVEYYAYTLLTSTDATTKGFLDKYDFYFFPVVNPDGKFLFHNSCAVQS